jgi:tRNA threonylcarbamoyladenosine biosynthesis protein TsaE
MHFESRSVEDTRRFGAQVASCVQAGDIFALEGELGAGKTEFVRGLVAALGGQAVVRSPSFPILNIYQTTKIPVYHFDFYRMSDCAELDEIGFYEYISGDGICLIEWGTMFADILPAHTKILRFKDYGENSRRIEWDLELKSFS